MKKILLISVALVIGIAVMAQKVQLKSNVRVAKQMTEQRVAIEPVKANPKTVTPGPIVAPGDGKDVVTIITIGTSANAYGYGYAGGQKTMVWADNDLGAVINFHRMGPGTTPPSLSGYLGFDLGVNQAGSAADWTVNQQAYNATLNAGGQYYADAGRYPQAVIFDPSGDGIDEAYCAFFAPNLSNDPVPWGGLSYGRTKLTDLSDSTKHLYWYSPPPYTYIPDGMTLTALDKILVTDLDQSWESGSLEYQGNIIYWMGTWNATDMDFEY